MAYYSFQSHFLVVKVQENNDIKGFSCTLFCPFGQNELDIKKCDAQILYILGNLRSPNKVRSSNRPKAVTEYTLIISFRSLYCQEGNALSCGALPRPNRSVPSVSSADISLYNRESPCTPLIRALFLLYRKFSPQQLII